jgi:hypothetical protein
MRIFDAATRLFAERGLTAAPTSEISKQAGVAEGTLFTYFRTEDESDQCPLPGDQAGTRRRHDVGFPSEEEMFVPGCDMFGIDT